MKGGRLHQEVPQEFRGLRRLLRMPRIRPDYKHQCRYCAYCVFTLEETWWCDEKSEDIINPKRPNRCGKFLFNPIPADGPLDKEYKPRRKSTHTQPRLFDMPTDRQRKKGETK